MNIKGFEDYKIYPNGNVENKYGKILKPQINNRGYSRVSLSKNGLCKMYLIHRLVALHYLDNPNNHAYVDHIDRDIKNNDLNNLRWINASENNLNKNIHKNNKLGVKNIYYSEKNNKYVFYKQINFKKYKKYFKTLEEAINYRDNFTLS
jgi:hypothetical protein